MEFEMTRSCWSRIAGSNNDFHTFVEATKSANESCKRPEIRFGVKEWCQPRELLVPVCR